MFLVRTEKEHMNKVQGVLKCGEVCGMVNSWDKWLKASFVYTVLALFAFLSSFSSILDSFHGGARKVGYKV